MKLKRWDGSFGTNASQGEEKLACVRLNSHVSLVDLCLLTRGVFGASFTLMTC